MGVALSGFLYLCRQPTERQPKFAQIIPLQWCPLTCTDADLCVKLSRTSNYHVPRLQSLAIAYLGTWSFFFRKVGEKGEIRGGEKMKWILPFFSLPCHHTLLAQYHSLGFFLPISYVLFLSHFLSFKVLKEEVAVQTLRISRAPPKTPENVRNFLVLLFKIC